MSVGRSTLPASADARAPWGERWSERRRRKRDTVRQDRARRARASLALAVAGLNDLTTALLPPMRGRLSLLLRIVPLAVPQLADALVGLAGIALLALAWGVRKGQRQAWAVSVALLAGTTILHLVKGVEVWSSLLSAAILYYLWICSSSFRTAVDRTSRRLAAVSLVLGTAAITLVAVGAIETYFVLDTDHPPLSLGRAYLAVVERLVGDESIGLPGRLNNFLSPTLVAFALALGAVTLFLLCRSVVERRRGGSAGTSARCREVVRKYGAGTLDYFALRHDKQVFFAGDTVVTYGVYGGVCLVSPDPIGPIEGRCAAWESFRRFADRNGWIVSVLGASTEWLEIYRGSGMRSIYVGDEAVVDLASFSLAGGSHKALRQAVNRIANHGYTVSFHDPAEVDSGLANELLELAAMSRRGEVERGFSMTLGRMFHPDDEGLLLAVAHDEQGAAVAFCQYVPSPTIGGYSLDVMRRDDGHHPNGLIDFVIVRTIDHLRTSGHSGLGLNFATMRAVFAGEFGRGWFERARCRLLRRLSRSMQIESLWRFTAKFDPSWLARYVVYDARQQLLPIGVAIARAESLWELPFIGRFLARTGRERQVTEEQRAA